MIAPCRVAAAHPGPYRCVRCGDAHQREERLIPHDLWERDRARFVRDLGLPRSCETFLQHLEAALSAGLEAVAEAVADGAMTIDKNMIVLPKAKPALEDPRLARISQTG